MNPPKKRTLTRGAVLFCLSGFVTSGSIGGTFAWYYGGDPSHSTREICKLIAGAKAKMDSCRAPIKGIPQLPYVSYLGVPYPYRLVFQIGLTVGASIIAIAFFDLFAARKREIEYRIKQAKCLADSTSDFADDSIDSSASPVLYTPKSPSTALLRTTSNANKSSSISQRFSFIQKLNTAQLIIGELACAALITLAWISLKVDSNLHTAATIAFFFFAILQLEMNVFIQHRSFRAVQAMDGAPSKNSIFTGRNDDSDGLNDHLLPDDLSPRLYKKNNKISGGSRGKPAQAGHWASTLETRMKIGCLLTILITGIIWGVATTVLRVKHVCTLCLAPPEEWIAIVCLFIAIVSYALDVQRNCGQHSTDADNNDDGFMGYSIIDHDVEDFS